MRTWVEISNKALERNITQLHRVIQKPMWLMGKSEFYGHGTETIVSEITNYKKQITNRIIGFGVSSGEEALALRKIAPHARVAVFADSSDTALEDLAQSNIELSLTGWDMVEQIKNYHGKHKIKVHIKIETGLNRFGFELKDLRKLKTSLLRYPDDTMSGLRSRRRSLATLDIVGIYSHFSAVEEGYYRSAHAQLEAFMWGAHALDPRHTYDWHMAATAAAIELPESRLDSVRCGIGIYGLSPSPRLIKNGSLIDFKPVLTWKTTIVAINHVRVGDTIGYGNTFKVLRPITIAVLPVGYADGYDRKLSNKGFVLVGGRRCPIVGRVFMNTTIIDITDAHQKDGKTITVGDEVVLIGRQGNKEISVDEVARVIGTINYEVVTRINWQIPRIAV